MELRTTTRTVIFRRPFQLSGFEQPQPPGAYTIDTKEQALDTLSVTGWQHLSTTMRLFRDGATEHVSIDPQELRDAMLRDGDQDIDPPAAPAVAQGRGPRLPAARQ
jgi:hypothetical protein